MPFKSKTDKRRKTFVRFITDVQLQFQKALSTERNRHNTTQSAIADKLDVDKSFVHRALQGGRNLTTQTIADLAWALNREIVFELKESKPIAGNSTWFASAVTDTTRVRPVTILGTEVGAVLSGGAPVEVQVIRVIEPEKVS